MADSTKTRIIDGVAEDLFSTLPLIGRNIRRKLLRTALDGFNKDITPPHFEIIKLLEESGSLHIAEIGEKLQIARPQMTHLIDRLVEMEIVARQTSTEDRRITNVTLTRSGKKMIKEHEDVIRRATAGTLANLTVEDLEALSASLKTLREIFSRLK